MHTIQEFDINSCSPDIIKGTGSHYTPSELADFISDHILLNFDFNKNQDLNILDPAIGDGELVLSLLNKIGKRHKGKIKVFGYDTNANAVKNTKQLILSNFPKVDVQLQAKDFLVSSKDISQKIDIAISNPPYVRTQVMGANKAQDIAKSYGLEGRVDLYYAFFPAIQETLKDNGIVGIITSNRFMTTKSGESVRELLVNNYKIDEIWDFGDTKMFDAAVLPCVLIMSPGKCSEEDDILFSSAYSCISDSQPKIKVKKTENLFENTGLIDFRGNPFEINTGLLELSENHRDVWKISNAKSKKFLETVAKNTDVTFKDIGKIRVGVKTTADKVFIRTRDEWKSDKVEAKALKELTTHHIARRWYADTKKRNKQILYTHEMGKDSKLKAIDFKSFPKAKKYLETNKDRLSSRTYVIEAGRKWYEIWVPQNPNAWPKQKVVFRDIAEKPTFWIDQEGSVINGDCYWFTNDNKMDNDVLWLALAVANSEFILKFYEYKFNNKLYSGRCRFMTQYVNSFPVPKIDLKDSQNIIKLSKEAYSLAKKDESTDKIESQINALVWKVFKVKKH